MDPVTGVEVLLFDVFGTVVDWRGSLTAQFANFGRQRGLKADWEKLAVAWQDAYLPAVNRVRKGERKFVSLEILRRESLDELLPTLGLKELTPADRAELVRCWARLHAWPDTVAALTALKKRFPLVALSNGGFGLLLDMARHARLPWDAILSADLFRHFKTDAEVYRGAAELLARPAGALMLVAAHNGDLAAARASGFKTAYVQRATEDAKPTEKWDILATDFQHLVKQLEA
jgi:2-haloacid dehalogenase